MVDGELWTRFFLHEPLFSVGCILSGYRNHPANRAKLYYTECIQEMERAIKIMKQRCSTDVLDNYSKLRLSQKFKNSFLRHIPVVRTGLNYTYPAAIKKASYKNVTWKNEMWLEQTLPFSI